MISLFIDTSLAYTTVAIVEDSAILSAKVVINDNTLSDRVFNYINECFDDSHKNIHDIHKIFIVTGPGSFTGTRVGVTIAKVMGWSLNIPVIPLSSLEFLATTNSNYDYIVAYIDARREYVYAGIYDKDLNVIKKDQHILISDLMSEIPKDGKVCWIGYEQLSNITNITPECDIIKIITKHNLDSSSNIHKLVPNYLKKTEAEEKFDNNEL